MWIICEFFEYCDEIVMHSRWFWNNQCRRRCIKVIYLLKTERICFAHSLIEYLYVSIWRSYCSCGNKSSNCDSPWPISRSPRWISLLRSSSMGQWTWTKSNGRSRRCSKRISHVPSDFSITTSTTTENPLSEKDLIVLSIISMTYLIVSMHIAFWGIMLQKSSTLIRNRSVSDCSCNSLASVVLPLLETPLRIMIFPNFLSVWLLQ